ncbi:MAG: phage terminase small subunit [Colwellia sp.]
MQAHIAAVKKQQVKEVTEAAHESGNVDVIKHTAENYSEFEVLTVAAECDASNVRKLASSDRNEARETFLKKYMRHVKAYLDLGDVYANPVFVYVVMMLVDLGRISDVVKFGFIAVAQQQQTPIFIKRDMATFISDSVLAWSEKEYKLGKSVSPYFNQTFTKLDEWSVPNVVKMKFNKLAGLIAFDEKKFEQTVKYFEAAIGFEEGSNKAKVGTKLNKAKELISKQKPNTSKSDNTAED